VSEEQSYSDHFLITASLNISPPETVYKRNGKNVDYGRYTEDVREISKDWTPPADNDWQLIKIEQE
jgi:hypothetical protein